MPCLYTKPWCLTLLASAPPAEGGGWGLKYEVIDIDATWSGCITCGDVQPDRVTGGVWWSTCVVTRMFRLGGWYNKCGHGGVWWSNPEGIRVGSKEVRGYRYARQEVYHCRVVIPEHKLWRANSVPQLTGYRYTVSKVNVLFPWAQDGSFWSMNP